MYSSNLSDMIVRHQMNERLEEARRERLARAVNRPSFLRILANRVASRLLRRSATPARETIDQELPAPQAQAGIS